MSLKKESSWKLIIYYYVIRRIISFTVNLIYWIFCFNDLEKAKEEKSLFVDPIENIKGIRILLKKFKWVSEKIDYRPWIITLVNKNFNDDCDGAAILGKYVFENLGYKTHIYHLKSNNEFGGHAVAVTKDKRFMISNNHLYTFSTKDIEHELDSYFDEKYDYFFIE